MGEEQRRALMQAYLNLQHEQLVAIVGRGPTYAEALAAARVALQENEIRQDEYQTIVDRIHRLQGRL